MNYRGGRWNVRQKQVLCCDLEEAKVLWSKSFDWVAPSTLSTSRGKVYFFDGKQVVALSRDDGSTLWKSAELPVWKEMATFYAPKLVVQGGTVMFVGGEDYVPHRGSAAGQVSGLSAENGKVVWTAKHLSGGYQSPEDLLVIDGKMWAANTTSGRKESPTGTGEILARNPATGKEESKFEDIPAYWFHHRCYPAKATEDYLIMSRTGTEFVDLKTGQWTLHHWVRGACLYGIMPANGLLYAPQHPCSCYIGAKMYGLTALAPASRSQKALEPVPDAQRLSVIGDAPAKFPQESVQEPGQWPTYRCDIARSGSVAGVTPPTRLKWSFKLSGPATQPVIADGKLLVADKDNSVLCALAAASGQPLWRYFPGGRLDSAPAVYRGLVYFGDTDGFVYCLNLSDGRLRWRYQAAPSLARHMYLEHMEATHPVHGNVLVMNDRLYTVAGRSMFNDGGIRFLVLDALTGRKLQEHVMDDKVPGTDEQLQMQHEILNMPMALSDLLSSNGKKIFMRYQPFDLDGNRLELIFGGKRYGYEKGTLGEDGAKAFEPLSTKQKGEDAHLFSATGFEDESWWHRTNWVYGNYQASGHNGYWLAGAKGTPAGRMITFDKERIYTWGRLQRYFKWSEEYVFHLHAQDYDYQTQWSVMLPILVRAMVASDNRLYVVGPTELMRQDEIKQRITEEEVQKLMVEQEKALDGRSGSTLLTVDKQTGKILSGLGLPLAPALDGMSGAYGNLYLAATDGTVCCLGADGEALTALSSDRIDELNKNSAPPPEPQKGAKKKPAAKAKTKAAPINLPPKDADFTKLEHAHAYQAEMGYRVAAEQGVGMVLKRLDAPLAGKVTLKCALRYANEEGSFNGYLAFGDSADEAELVKCGLRLKMKTAAIIQGPLSKNKGVTTPCVTEQDKPYALTVTVDLATGDVAFEGGGVQVAAKLERPLKSITHVGYCLNGALTDFSPIETTVAR